MGPHSFKCGKRRRRMPGKPGKPALQWGRTLSSAERRRGDTLGAFRLRNASMGPHSFKCGKRPIPAKYGWSTNASMGPHSFKCGKRPRGSSTGLSALPGFNGAALFQVRKVHRLPLYAPNTHRASMGPHSFKCGKNCRRRRLECRRCSFNGAALFQVRKGTANRKNNPWTESLQWGRTLSSAERAVQKPTSPGSRRLQWGRTLSSAERPFQRITWSGFTFGFNGAALFQVRKDYHEC